MFKGLFDFRTQTLQVRWLIIAPVIIFIFLGLISLSSTSDLNQFNSTFYKQCVWLILGCFIFVIVQYVRLQFIYDYSYIFYIFLILLIGITAFAPVIEGSRRWIILGNIYFQPSEFGKILYVASMARFFSDNRSKDQLSFYFITILFLSLLPALLIIKQPDLGTAISYLSIILPLIFWTRVKVYIIFFLVSPIFSIFATYQLWVYYLWMFLFFIVLLISRPKFYIAFLNFILNISCAISAPYIWSEFLRPHQKERILTFLNPLIDPLGSGYQVIQSMISIGSGGFFGKGLGNGTQTHLKFLPVRDSDFIISVLAEEHGFKSIALIIICISIFVYWCLIYAQKIDNKYISTLIIGYCTIIYMHMVINMGMISGLLPVTGLPAPFISYGGSFFLTCSIIVGLINNAVSNHL